MYPLPAHLHGQIVGLEHILADLRSKGPYNQVLGVRIDQHFECTDTASGRRDYIQRWEKPEIPITASVADIIVSTTGDYEHRYVVAADFESARAMLTELVRVLRSKGANLTEIPGSLDCDYINPAHLLAFQEDFEQLAAVVGDRLVYEPAEAPFHLTLEGYERLSNAFAGSPPQPRFMTPEDRKAARDFLISCLDPKPEFISLAPITRAPETYLIDNGNDRRCALSIRKNSIKAVHVDGLYRYAPGNGGKTHNPDNEASVRILVSEGANFSIFDFKCGSDFAKARSITDAIARQCPHLMCLHEYSGFFGDPLALGDFSTATDVSDKWRHDPEGSNQVFFKIIGIPHDFSLLCESVLVAENLIAHANRSTAREATKNLWDKLGIKPV
ncbi:MAG: hypothetical protein EBQ96_05890 [Proteobacteria bacterium]|nr:hypothetical protein [Pseudomonadota bacterium]